MELAVPRAAFQRQKLLVRTASLFSGPCLLLNGAAVKRTRGKYIVHDDSGAEVAVRLKANFVDPIPTVIVGDQVVRVAPALTWYEYLWIGIPIILLFVGGALGAGIGIFATYASSRILRSDRTTVLKYVLTGLVSLGAFVVFVVVAVVLKLVIGRADQ